MSQNVVNWQISGLQGTAMWRSALFDPLLLNVAIVLSLTAMLTASDAFETSSLGLLHSVALWSLVSLLMVVQTCLTHRLFLAFFPISPASKIFAVGLALSSTVLLMTIELHWLKFTPLLPKAPDPFFEFILFVSQPVLAVGCLTLVAQTGAIQRYVDFLQSRAGADVSTSSDLDLLKTVIGQHEVLRVSAQDHYLELLCSDRTFLLRSRMKDALPLLSSSAGMQVHRSHWLARRHVQRLLKQGRDLRLLLNDGSQVPVARPRSQSVKRFFESASMS